MRKAQVAGQIFVYILAVIIVSLIITYGYKAIKGFSEKSDEVAYITLRTDMKNAVTAIISDYGSIKRPKFPVPQRYKRVCVVDTKMKSLAEGGNTGLCSETIFNGADYEPIACEGWKIGRDNVFLVPDGSDSFNIGTVTIDDSTTANGYHCFDVINGKINMQLKSFGSHVKLRDYT